MTVFIAALPVGAIIALGIGWYVAMIGVLLAALAVELLNTAIEKLADRVTSDHDPQIGMVKDYGSAAVFCMRACRRCSGRRRWRSVFPLVGATSSEFVACAEDFDWFW